MQQTSLDAFDMVKPKINANQRIILDVFEGAACDLTNAEVAKYIGWSINRVTPRVLELRKKCLLRYAMTRRCGITGNKSNSWAIL